MHRNPYSGKFIVFEGLDGSGQSTQAGLLYRYFQEQNYSAILTKEPAEDFESGKRIRQVLQKKETMSSGNLQKLFVNNRKDHLENLIIPCLKEGWLVISDRYFLSTCAFGGINLDIEWLIKLNGNFILPDITFVLDVPSEICLQRIDKRGTTREFFEEKQKLAKVLENYRTLAKRFPNTYLIDGRPLIEVLFKSVLDMITKII